MSKFSSMRPDLADATANVDDGYKANDPTKRHFSTYMGPLKDQDMKFYRSAENDRARVRALPNKQHKFFAMPVPQHSLHNGSKTWICSSFEGKTTCPACALSRTAYGENDKETGKKYRAKERYYIYVIDRNKPEEGVMILDLPGMSMESLSNVVQDDAGIKRSVDHLDLGHDILFTRRKNQGDFVMPSDFALSTQPCSIADCTKGVQSDEVVMNWLKWVDEHPIKDNLNILPDAKVREIMELPEESDPEDAQMQKIADQAIAQAQANATAQQTSTTQPPVSKYEDLTKAVDPLVSASADKTEVERAEMMRKVEEKKKAMAAEAEAAARKAAELAAAQNSTPVAQESTTGASTSVPSMEDLMKQMAELGIS